MRARLGFPSSEDGEQLYKQVMVVSSMFIAVMLILFCTSCMHACVKYAMYKPMNLLLFARACTRRLLLVIGR